MNRVTSQAAAVFTLPDALAGWWNFSPVRENPVCHVFLRAKDAAWTCQT
jgi:hypothetical protein